MPDCRVELREGDPSCPVIIISPHSPDEDHTDTIAEIIAEKLDAYAIINKGWERADSVDFLKDKANCNDVNQLLSDEVLQDEFLNPLVSYVQQIRQRHFSNVYIFIIHGFGATVDDKSDIILGTGIPDRASCEVWRHHAFTYFLADTGLDVAGGTGRFAGRSRSNLNQFFKHKTALWQNDSSVQSFQIEIEHSWRRDGVTSNVVAEALWKSIDKLVDLGNGGWPL